MFHNELKSREHNSFEFLVFRIGKRKKISPLQVRIQELDTKKNISKDEKLELNRCKTDLRKEYLTELLNKNKSVSNIAKRYAKETPEVKNKLLINAEIEALDRFPCYPLSYCGEVYKRFYCYNRTLPIDMGVAREYISVTDSAMIEAFRYMDKDDPYRAQKRISPILMIITRYLLGEELNRVENDILNDVFVNAKTRDELNIGYKNTKGKEKYLDILQKAEGALTKSLESSNRSFLSKLTDIDKIMKPIIDLEMGNNQCTYSFDISKPGFFTIRNIDTGFNKNIDIQMYIKNKI